MERQRRIRDVLLWAHAIYRRGGVTLTQAVGEAADGSATGYYALTEVRRILLELNLDAWEKHPARSRRDVHVVLRKAAARLTPHRGGWTVTP